MITPSPSTHGTPAVVLLSGGLDSTTLLAQALRDGYSAHALTVRYGQRHAHEVDAARRIAELYGVPHHVAEADLRAIGGSALTADIAVPKDRAADEIGAGIPVTYVPARNTVLLSLALAWAEVLEATDIFIGVNARDYSGYPDCRPEYYRVFQELIRAGTRPETQIEIMTPVITLKKSEIIRRGIELGAPLHLTWSCYQCEEAACGMCDSCLLRLRAFAEAGVPDPIPYRQRVAAQH